MTTTTRFHDATADAAPQTQPTTVVEQQPTATPGLDLTPAPPATYPVAVPAPAPALDLTPRVPVAHQAPVAYQPPVAHQAPVAPAPVVAPSVAPGPGRRPRTPAEAYAALLEGNSRFTGNAPHYPNHHTARRDALTQGQEPFAVVFSCADSRVPPELVFDRGLGDLFVVRTAGHVIGPTSLGTIDYAVENLDTPLIAVVGHASCGAVAATVGAHETGRLPDGNIRALVDRVMPSVTTAKAEGDGTLDECIVQHVNATVNQLPVVSPAIAQRLDAGTLGVVGMVYHLSNGRTEVISHLGDFRI